MNHFTDGPYTAYIDWADTEHDVCLQAVGSEQREFTQLAVLPSVGLTNIYRQVIISTDTGPGYSIVLGDHKSWIQFQSTLA